jgi:hypothetical protein
MDTQSAAQEARRRREVNMNEITCHEALVMAG